MSDSDDDAPKLSEHTLKALQEFYSQENNLTVDSSDSAPVFKEDWQLSQFWYDEKTTLTLATEAVRAAGTDGKIALISCPTLYKTIREESPSSHVKLFEFDRRFATYGQDFIFYDYNNPLDVPRDLSRFFDVVVADPPFLSEECLTKTAVTIKFLARRNIIICTGVVMEDLIKRLLDLTKSVFEPRHQHNLANEFGCFSNYNIDEHIVQNIK